VKKLLIIWVLAALLFACSEQAEEQGISALPVGTVAVVQSDGRVFESDLTYMEGAFSKWEFSEYQLTRKYYRGVFIVSGANNESEFWYEFDVHQLDVLFPMEVGKEVSFKGKYFSQNAEGVEFWSHISIRGSDTVLTKQGSQDVFVVDTVTEMTTKEGPVRLSKTIWYSPKFGRALKALFIEDGKEYITRILDIQIPKGQPLNRRNKGMGTVLI
jgi:hypothetical protein